MPVNNKNIGELLIEAVELCENASEGPWQYELSPYPDERGGYRVGNSDYVLGLIHNEQDAEFVTRSRVLIPELTKAIHESRLLPRLENCHIWEGLGDNLETLSNRCEVLISAQEIHRLIHEKSSSNEPLTLDELKQMDGEPVWVVPINLDDWICDPVDGIPAWASVRKSWARVWREQYADLRCSDFHFEEYGTVWVAYRNKLKLEGAL